MPITRRFLAGLLGLTYLISGMILARCSALGDSSMEPISAVAGVIGAYATLRLHERFSSDPPIVVWLNGYPGFLVTAVVGLILAWPSSGKPGV